MDRSNSVDFKVAQIIGRLDGGGAQRLTFNLAHALQKEGVDSSIIAMREGGSFVQKNDVIDIHVLSIVPGKISSLLRGLLSFRRLVRTLDLDFIHVHGASCLPFCILALCGTDRPRILFTWHDSESVVNYSGWRRTIMLYSLRRCGYLYGSSRNVAARLAASLDNKRSVEVFTNGVPVSAPRYDSPGKDIPHIIWVGRLVPPKAPLILLEAAAQLLKENLSFRIIIVGNSPAGGEWYEVHLQEKVREWGLDEVVSLPGWVTDMQQVYASADIAVQTSKTEGLSMALLEQMMAGLAIVATEVGDTAEALQHGRCGLLMIPGDVKGLHGHLRRLLVNPELRRKLGEAAHERAVMQYSLQAMASRAHRDYMELYRMDRQ